MSEPTDQPPATSVPPFVVPQAVRAAESPELRYTRQTASATVFIAWVVGIVFVANLVLGIIVAVKLNDLNHAFSNLGNPTPKLDVHVAGRV